MGADPVKREASEFGEILLESRNNLFNRKNKRRTIPFGHYLTPMRPRFPSEHQTVDGIEQSHRNEQLFDAAADSICLVGNNDRLFGDSYHLVNDTTWLRSMVESTENAGNIKCLILKRQSGGIPHQKTLFRKRQLSASDFDQRGRNVDAGCSVACIQGGTDGATSPATDVYSDAALISFIVRKISLTAKLCEESLFGSQCHEL